MTRYYFHGGYAWIDTPSNREFFQSLRDEIQKEEIIILILPFAREKYRWEVKSKEVSEQFSRTQWNQKIIIAIGDEDIDILCDQIKNADVIFLWWGETEKLQRKIEMIPNFHRLLEGKIVAWSSAGALIFSQYYYENDNDRYSLWLWILPIGMICHWKNQEEQLAYIKKYWEVNEVLCIAEWKFLVREM